MAWQGSALSKVIFYWHYKPEPTDRNWGEEIRTFDLQRDRVIVLSLFKIVSSPLPRQMIPIRYVTSDSRRNDEYSSRWTIFYTIFWQNVDKTSVGITLESPARARHSLNQRSQIRKWVGSYYMQKLWSCWLWCWSTPWRIEFTNIEPSCTGNLPRLALLGLLLPSRKSCPTSYANSLVIF